METNIKGCAVVEFEELQICKKELFDRALLMEQANALDMTKLTRKKK